MANAVVARRGRFVLLVGLVLPSSALLAGCHERLPEVTPEEGIRVVEVAEPAAGELLRTLLGRLDAALEEGGAPSAVEFCSQEAIPLTRMVEAGLEGGLELKRTSFRYRNPDNAPDSAEEMALRYFEDAILEYGEAPAEYVQRVSEEELRYYRPLFVAPLCLQCHGDPAAMDPAVNAKLEATYPGDLAVGYEVGDFRGVVRVSVPEAEIRSEG